MILYTVWEGPTIQVSPSLQTQACLVHAETWDEGMVINSMPGGAAAGWIVPPVWQTSDTPINEDGSRGETDTRTTVNPRVNKKDELMWLVVRRIEC